MVRLYYSVPAVNDLKSIYNFIASDSSYYAKRFVMEIKDRIKILKTHPEQGRIIYPDRYKDLQQILYKNYRILYKYDEIMINIITIHHQSRELDNIHSLKPFEL